MGERKLLLQRVKHSTSKRGNNNKKRNILYLPEFIFLSFSENSLFLFICNTGQCQFVLLPSWKNLAHTHTHTFIKKPKQKKFYYIGLCLAIFLLNTISFSLLPPYSDDAISWFALVDAFFQVFEISPKWQLTLLLCGMPPSLVQTVREIITRPPPNLTYEILKGKILKRNTASAESHFRSLMQDELLGDRKPTEFLRCLHELSYSVVENAPLIKKLFFSPDYLLKFKQF